STSCVSATPNRPIGHPADSLVPQPRLEHQYVPEVVLPVLPSTEMRRPHLPDGLGPQIAFLPQTRLIEQVLGPVAQGASQPAAQRNTETLLGSVDELARYMAVQHLAQQPF